MLRVTSVVLLCFLIGITHKFMGLAHSEGRTEIIATYSSILSANDTTRMRIMGIISQLKFEKSSAILIDITAAEILKNKLKNIKPSGSEVAILGYAYFDEDNPEALAKERGAAISKLLSEEDTIRYSGQVIDDAYSSDGYLIGLSYYSDPQDNSSGSDTSDTMTSKIVIGKDKIFYYIDSLDNNNQFDDGVLNSLRSVARYSHNNLYKIHLTSYNENVWSSDRMTYFMEESLIRYGLSPHRVYRFKRPRGDRRGNVIELQVVE